MHYNYQSKRPIAKAVALFFLSGFCSGFCLGWIVTRESLKEIWFHQIEYWKVPNWNYWIGVGASFFLSLVFGYTFAYFKGWLRSSNFDSSKSRQFTGAFIIAIASPIIVVVGAGAERFFGYWVLFNGPILIIPTYGVAIISLALWVFTKKLDKRAIGLMVLTGFLIYPVANLVFIPLDLLRFGNTAFEFSLLMRIKS